MSPQHHLMVILPRQEAGPPLGPPPSPEYLKESIQTKLLAINCTLFAIAFVTVLLRIYVRVFMLRSFGLDDWLMMVAMLLSIACCVCLIVMVKLGIGLHAEAIKFENILPIFAWTWFYSIFIIFAYSFIKLSIGFFLLRIAQRTNFRRFLYGVQIFLVLFTIGSTLAIILRCRPVRAGWDITLLPPLGTAKCYDNEIFKNVGIFNSSINIATDLLFAILPIPLIWKLHVTKRTKISLAIILSLGFFASATAIVKVPMQANFFKVKDWSGEGAWYYIWQQVEMNVGIIAACLPTLKPLFINLLGSVRALTSGSTPRSKGYKSNTSLGYIKQNSHNDPNSNIALGDMGNTGVKNPYSVNVTTAGARTEFTMYGSPPKREDGISWDMKNNGANSSDESILPLQGAGARDGIVRTTEVTVS